MVFFDDCLVAILTLIKKLFMSICTLRPNNYLLLELQSARLQVNKSFLNRPKILYLCNEIKIGPLDDSVFMIFPLKTSLKDIDKAGLEDGT